MYLRQRTLLLNSVANYCTPALHVHLQGDLSLSDSINESIFKNVHNFIIDCKRFKNIFLSAFDETSFKGDVVFTCSHTHLVSKSPFPVIFFSLMYSYCFLSEIYAIVG